MRAYHGIVLDIVQAYVGRGVANRVLSKLSLNPYWEEQGELTLQLKKGDAPTNHPPTVNAVAML